MIIAKLTLKQKRFADEYIISGNAYQSAIKAGYSEKYAKTDSHKLLENTRIKKYVNERLDELQSATIASQEEVLEYLSSVMRGEQREQTLISIGEAGQEIVDIDVGAKDRIRAGTELLKRYPMDPEERKLRLERMRLENEKLKSQIGGEEGQDDKIAEFIDRLKGAVVDDN